VGTSTGGKVSHSTELTTPSPSAETVLYVHVDWVFISCNCELYWNQNTYVYCIISLWTVRWWTRQYSFYPSVCINRNTATRVSNISQFIRHIVLNCGPGRVVGIVTAYGLDSPGIESWWGARFSAPVQTGPEAHPASCTMGTGSSPGERCGRGVTVTPHPLLVPGSKIERAIPLFSLKAFMLNFYSLTVSDFSHSIHISVLERLILRLHWVSFIYYIFAVVTTTFIILYPLHQKFPQHQYIY
jgi:hypothetical protein